MDIRTGHNMAIHNLHDILIYHLAIMYTLHCTLWNKRFR